jgi:hypothetical protein
MKNRFLISVLIFYFSVQLTFAQENEKKFEPGGKATGTVFLNYHYDMTKNAEKKSQFELLRSYFGYLYNFSENFSSKIVFDVANDGKAFSAFLKNASLEWKKNNAFSLEGGMISTHAFDTQEKFYGYRYILETLQDKDKFYSSADLGVKATFKPVDKVEFHAGLYNGEGYKKIQDDFGCHKASFDVVLRPVKGLTFKTYYDLMPKRDTAIYNEDMLQTQNILNFFLGYEVTNLFRLGVEYDFQKNSANRNDYNLTGISAYGTWIMNKIELFARYDQLASNTINGATSQWNINKDYSMVLGGIQYAPVKGIKMAMNYRHYVQRKSESIPFNLIYLNAEYKF